VISLNLVLAGLRLSLKNCQVGEKWVSDDCSYLSISLECISADIFEREKAIFVEQARHIISE
jgi:hypothetical protein